jgi:hypothetical protein
MSDDTEYRLAYACWRFDMWLADQGTYSEIDDKVTRGELIPLVKAEHQEAALAKRRGKSPPAHGFIGRLIAAVFGEEGTK